MPTSLKISKDMILDTAFKIAQSEGLESVSNRRIAKELNCSIRPIYYQFKNVLELHKDLYVRIEKYFYKYVFDNTISSVPLYKQIGINYIKFAKEENKLFHILFMSETKLFCEDFIKEDVEDYKELENIIKISTNLSEEAVLSFHTKMWIFCHGIATLVANDTIYLTDNQIEELLSYEFQALMLLEENPNNKWILLKKEEK